MALQELESYRLENPRNQKPMFLYSKVSYQKACVMNQDEVVDYFNIIWLKKGNAQYQIDFQTFLAADETIIFLAPGQVFTVLSEEVVEGHRLAFDSDFYCLNTHHHEIGCNGLLFNDFSTAPYIQVDEQDSLELLHLVKEIEKSLKSSGTARTELLQSYLKIFLIKTTHIKKMQRGFEVEVDEVVDPLTDFNHLVNQHFRKVHSVSEYAEMMFLSPKSLSKKLAKFGQKPSKIIQERLILEAKRLLYHTEKDVKEITYELGYDDPSYFSRFFKKHTGYAPAQFRGLARNTVLTEYAGR